MALFHKFGVKTGFTFVLQFLMLISDCLWCFGINFYETIKLWERTVFDIKPDSLNLVWITDDEQRLEEDQEDDSEGPQPTPFNPLIFWPAALCDMTATSIQYIALTLTYASSFQMLRGKTKHLFFVCVFYQLCGFIFPIILLHASAGGRSEKLRWHAVKLSEKWNIYFVS